MFIIEKEEGDESPCKPISKQHIPPRIENLA